MTELTAFDKAAPKALRMVEPLHPRKRDWLVSTKRQKPAGQSDLERENAELRKENRLLREERGILKKATVFFAERSK